MPIGRNTIHTEKRKRLAGLFSFVVDDTETRFLFRLVMTLGLFSIATMELLLNHTTLFYHNISSTKINKTEYGPVANWANQVS